MIKLERRLMTEEEVEGLVGHWTLRAKLRPFTIISESDKQGIKENNRHVKVSSLYIVNLGQSPQEVQKYVDHLMGSFKNCSLISPLKSSLRRYGERLDILDEGTVYACRFGRTSFYESLLSKSKEAAPTAN